MDCVRREAQSRAKALGAGFRVPVPWLVVLALCATVAMTSLAATAKAGDGPAEQFFEKRVRPLLIARCLDCHGEDAAESELRVDSLDGMLRGGVRGPAIVPGKPEESLLIRAVRHGEVLKMPAKSKLPAEEIDVLARWIADGAAWPGQTPSSVRPENSPAATDKPSSEPKPSDGAPRFWAFEPPRAHQLPAVRDRAWVQSPVDAFVLARLEAAGLRPAPTADKRTLIRRATFLLLGLPPTPEEVEAFLNDTSPDAFERVVDRLLGSPRYGERWGRHWLDVARYADSNGLDENLAYANAFRYRDYVVQAFNRDMPYDRFVREQLAGDLLEPDTTAAEPGGQAGEPWERMPPTVATGFLCIGPKMLAEDDPVKLRMDIIDEQLDTLGRALLGMTVGCARCHDHKFDPISTSDYYALAGIFYSTKTMDTLTVVAKWHERPLADPVTLARRDAQQRDLDAVRARAATLREQSAREVIEAARRHVGDYLLAAESARREDALLASTQPLGPQSEQRLPPGAVLLEAENYDRGNVLRDTTNYGQGIGVLVNQGATPNFVEYDVPLANAGRYRLEVRYAAAATRPCQLRINQTLAKSDVADGVTGSWFPDSQRWEVEGFFALRQGVNTLRLEQPKFFPHIDKLLLVPTTEPEDASARLAPLVADYQPLPELVHQWREQLQKPSETRDPALAAWFQATARNAAAQDMRQLAARYQSWVANPAPSDPVPDAKAPDAAAPDVAASDVDVPAEQSIENVARQRESFLRLLSADDGPFRLPKTIDSYFATATRTQLEKLDSDATRLQASLPELPMAMSVTEDSAEDLRVHYRGSHLTLGPPVARGFPASISSESPPPIGVGSGRRELAEWLTSPRHPLTARVLVNRIWLWHFGQGLVRSPDNFGQLGERPTHPELLDWLALQLIRSDWSIKQLHRVILLSSTWRMSTTLDARALELDPENRLLWRRQRQRLRAESIRDGLLAVSDDLDTQMYGSLLPTKNRAYVTSTANIDPVVYVSNRRSIYLPVVRSALYEVFQAFDFADPSVINGQRQSTTVAPQALFMMNSSLANTQTERLARRLLNDSAARDSQRVERLYELAYSRAPRELEMKQSLEFVSEYQRRWRALRPDDTEQSAVRAWQALCRVVLSANEFLYLE